MKVEKIEKSGVCVKCGGPLPAGADVRGTCPRCMLKWAFAEDPEATRAAPRRDEDEPTLRGKFGPFEILEELGRGGMGVVYKARQANLDRIVAVKVLPDSLARDDQFTVRFQREARAMAALAHPNIVSVHDFGCIDGKYYFAMEYVDGKSLRALLQEGPMPPARALEIVPPLCDALHFAHQQGVVHRDIKPENILIGSDGRVKVADFGLAKIVGKTSLDYRSLTRSDHVVGTLNYMAPEQIERPKDVDHRADVYALGVVFYEMLTGELPLGRFDPPSHKSGVGPHIDHVVMTCLEKRPERRFQRVSEMKEAALRPAPLARGAAPAPLGWGVPQPPQRRGRLVVALMSGAGVAMGLAFLLAAGGASLKSADRQQRRVAQSEANPVAVERPQYAEAIASSSIGFEPTAVIPPSQVAIAVDAGGVAQVVQPLEAVQVRQTAEADEFTRWAQVWEVARGGEERLMSTYGKPGYAFHKTYTAARVVLADYFGCPEPDTMRHAIEGLGVAIAPGLMEVALDGSSPADHRARALRALGWLKRPDTLARLAGLLSDDQPESVRRELLAAFGAVTGRTYASVQEAMEGWERDGTVKAAGAKQVKK